MNSLKLMKTRCDRLNIARRFQLISEMSINDLAKLGHSMGFAPTLDNPKTARYQPAYATSIWSHCYSFW